MEKVDVVRSRVEDDPNYMQLEGQLDLVLDPLWSAHKARDLVLGRVHLVDDARDQVRRVRACHSPASQQQASRDSHRLIFD